MKNVPFIVLANKQDSNEALSAEIITDKLELNQWPNGSYNVIPCCALTGDGLTNAFTILAKLIRKQAKKHRLEID